MSSIPPGAGISIGLRGPCDAGKGKACPGSADPQPMPRPIRFGDTVTWTTGPQWNTQYPDDSSESQTGSVYNIEMSGFYWFGSQKKERVPQVATSSGRSHYPPIGAWRIDPVNPEDAGKIVHYGDTSKPFRLAYKYRDIGDFYVGKNSTSWPVEVGRADQGPLTFIDGEMIFDNLSPTNQWNYGVTVNLVGGRADTLDSVFYGDLMSLRVRNEDSFQRDSHVYVMRGAVGNSKTPVKTQPGFGADISRFPEQWPVYPFLASWLRPSGTEAIRGDISKNWYPDDWSRFFMMWPGGTIGNESAGLPDACKCACDDKVGGYYFCRKTGEFTQCRGFVDKKTGIKKYKWTGCEAAMDCRGVMATNVCGELDASNYSDPCPGETSFCCDHDTQTWRCRGRDLPSGIAFSCPAPQNASAYESASAHGCPHEQWQCQPPDYEPILPLVKTKARMAAAAAKPIPLVVPKDGDYTCGARDLPVALCTDVPSA